MRLLRLKVKEMETIAVHDRSLRNKVTEDSGHAAWENARLHQQVMELELEVVCSILLDVIHTYVLCSQLTKQHHGSHVASL